MAMEVVCGNCQGRLLVEQTGVIVACPHCGAHLQIGDPTPAAAPVPPPAYVPPVPQPVAPSPFVPSAAPPVLAPPPVVAPPPAAPFPISFEPPAAKQPESFFPEIVLTPKSAPKPPAPAVSPPAPVPVPAPPTVMAPPPVPPPAPAPAAPSTPFPISFEPPAEPVSAAASESFFPEIVLNPAAAPAAETPQAVTPTPVPAAIAPSTPSSTPATEPVIPAVIEPPAGEPQFPEINLIPPAVVAAAPPAAAPTIDLATPVSPPASTAEAIAPPAWAPAPETATESESWMPAIDLTMPPKSVQPSAVAATSAVTPDATPALPVATSSELPNGEAQATIAAAPPAAVPVAATSPSTVNLSAFAPPADPAHRTDIWSPARLENAPVAEPAFGNYAELSAGDVPTVTLTAPVASTAAVAMANPAIPVNSSAVATPSAPATAATSAGPAIVTNDIERERGVPRLLFVIVASYASAITLAFLYVWLRGNVSTLDLPDVVPAFKNGKYGMVLIDEGPLPTPFRLKLGESKRYGNLLVTPIKVTKGPLQFVHFDGDGQTRPATESPVLKLWVKFENVSSDQTFPPLDEKLLFQRAPDREVPTQDRTNNYVCLQSERKRTGKRIPVYTFPINGEWILKDQGLNSLVAPNSSWETYIPSNDEDLSDLKGPLCWRVHFRKGYNPKSRRGVTTLVEVEFDSKDIQADS